jgi:hypothetical protein
MRLCSAGRSWPRPSSCGAMKNDEAAAALDAFERELNKGKRKFAGRLPLDESEPSFREPSQPFP